MNISLAPFAPDNLVSRETGSAVPSRVSLVILHTQAKSGAYSRAPLLPSTFYDGVHLHCQPPYAIVSVPSLSGHAIAHRWRSPPRVRRPRASSSQGSSSNGCYLFRLLHAPISVQLSFSHTQFWYSGHVRYRDDCITRYGVIGHDTACHGRNTKTTRSGHPAAWR